MDIQPSPPSRAGLREFQFSLGRLLAAVTLCAILFASLPPGFEFARVAPLLLAAILIVLFVLFSDWSFWHVGNGTVALEYGNFERAISEFTKGIAARPNDPERHCARAVAHHRKRDLPAAIADYSAAIGISARCSSAWFGRALARQANGEHQHAIDDATIGLCIEPENVRGLMIRGYSYCFVGDAVAGISDLNEAVRLAPEQGAIYLTRGLAYLCIGEWATALPDFQHTPPDLRGGTWLLGRTMAIFQLGRYEQAICEAKDFLAADNEDVHASAALAWFLATCPVASLRDGEQSVRLAQKAKNGASLDWWMIHACLAVARAETGSFKDAIRHGHVALQTAPAGWRGKCEAALACFTTDRPYRDESINPTSAGEGVQSH